MGKAHWLSSALLATLLAAAGVPSDGRASGTGSAAVPLVPGPVRIDGRLDEWRKEPGGWGALAWDPTALYVGLSVPDAKLQVDDDRTRDFSGSDRIVVLVGPSPSAGVGSGDGPLTERDFAFVLTPGSRYGRPLKTTYGFGGYEHVELDLRHVEVAASANQKGYTLEARIPWTLLGIRGEAGQTLRLEVLAMDADQAGATVKTISGQAFPGSIGTGLLKPAILSAE